jgi:hypothetical protein
MGDQVRREEVRFRSDGLALADTLAAPTADGPVPAVLMRAG